MNMQIQRGDKWYFLESIHANFLRTTASREDALSADYIDVLRNIFPTMNFRSI